MAALSPSDLLQWPQLAGGRLRQLGLDFRMADNAFTHIADWQRAQHISNGWEAKRIHARLNELARMCCPIYKDFASVQEERSSISSLIQWNRKGAATPDSICSTPTMKSVVLYRSRRVQYQRTTEQNASPPSASSHQQPGVTPAQTTPNARQLAFGFVQ
jgi:hypothetical protein